MKQFAAAAYIAVIVFTGFDLRGNTQRSAGQQDSNISHTASETCFYSSGYKDLTRYDANREPDISFAQHLLPSVNKFSLPAVFAGKHAENLRKCTISEYIYSSEFQVVRFEGPDINHPFNCFW
ncbi:MAG TPA: hypothetical protein ENO20_07300 [Bacteroides sp.]|nr:hypothetical protein [Bacteroides sp.]